jgi:ABC-type transport system substrate-binding protein
MRRSTRLIALAMLSSLALVAAACGGDDDDGETADTTAAAPATTAEAATTTAGGTDTTAAPAGDLLAYDESEQCGTEGYSGNLAGIEATSATEVVFTLCSPDVAFPSKVAFSALQIVPQEYLESTGGTGDLIDKPIGTGPYKLEAWERGNQIVLTANEDYWGDAPLAKTVVFRWSTEPAQRLVELESGAADGIDNVGVEDVEKVRGNSDLQLIERDPLNVFYVGFNRDKAPFDNELVRQAVGYAIDRDRIVENFYGPGSIAATQFLPPDIFGYTEGFQDFTYDPEKAKELLAEAGLADGFETALSLRDVSRGYLSQAVPVATDIQAQLAEVGIKINIDVQESTTFLDNADAGNLGLHMLGWGADYPDATNFLDFHFGQGASPQFGAGFEEIWALLSEAASTADADTRQELYNQANELIAANAPMIPIAHGGSAVAYKADVQGAHASPLGNEALAVMGIEGQDQFVWVQNGEPGGLWCADETDGEALRVCEQIGEALLAYEIGGTEVIPSLATEFSANDDGTVWTFTLREGVTFHDGSAFDANDVVATWRAQWDAADPAHVGRTGDFTYFSAFFNGFLNAEG